MLPVCMTYRILWSMNHAFVWVTFSSRAISIGNVDRSTRENVKFQRYCTAVGRSGALQISKTPVAAR
jgi:hypothetical protein